MNENLTGMVLIVDEENPQSVVYKLSQCFYKGGDNEIEPTAEQRASQEIATKQWKDVKKRFLPLEKRLAGITLDRDLHKSRDLSTVAAATTEAFTEAQKGVAKGASARGINPNSGAVDNLVARGGDTMGRGIAEAETGVSQGRDDQRRKSAIDITATAREIEGQTMMGYDTIGNIELQKDMAIDQARQYERSAYANAAGQVIGFGVGHMTAGGGGGGGANFSSPTGLPTPGWDGVKYTGGGR